jgi:hypothetical protein
MGNLNNMLKTKEQIENYKEKSKFLKENGWTDLWHEDNWVMTEWYNNPKLDIDRAGCSTDMAYNICKNSKKNLEF